MPATTLRTVIAVTVLRLRRRMVPPITSTGISMKKLLVIAALLSIGTASAETNALAPAEAPSPAMVRNIGFAEQGDAIIVRQRKFEPVPAIKPAQK
jgi:hypothetical protein